MDKSLWSENVVSAEKSETECDSVLKDETIIASDLLDRLEAIELYFCELMDVMADYESSYRQVSTTPVAENVPVEFLKWDLFNMMAESRVDAVRLKSKLKQKARLYTPVTGSLLN